MKAAKSYSPEVRGTAARTVLEQQKDHPSQGEIEFLVEVWIGQ